MKDFFIALLISVAITAIWAWVGDWSGQRHYGAIRRRLAARRCPVCASSYGDAPVEAAQQLIPSHGLMLYEITCP